MKEIEPPKDKPDKIKKSAKEDRRDFKKKLQQKLKLELLKIG